MMIEYPRACARSAGVTANAKAIWLNDWKFMVAVSYPSNAAQAITPPKRPPTTLSSTASTSTDKTTGMLPNPSARNVAISRVRLATAVYIVMTAPNAAPTPISTPIIIPIVRMIICRVCVWLP